ncbi:MAG: capsular biosynthesis protein [Bacteroidetes bacterium]|nr:capsular biosynthesis protein [Bacteroidota bacterium]
MNHNLVAVIPAKSNSSRVPNKNFKPFYESQSLLEIKIRQALDSGIFSEIYVSSDSDEARHISERLGVKFLLRDFSLCVDETPWGTVLRGILNQVPVSQDTLIGWLMPTSPLFSDFKSAYARLLAEPEKDSLLTVTRLKHFYLNADYIPINHQWGVWHSYSQGIRPIFHMNLAFFISPKSMMMDNQYQIGNKPIFYEIGPIESQDIDTPTEFETCQVLYQAIIQKRITL